MFQGDFYWEMFVGDSYKNSDLDFAIAYIKPFFLI
jgi:hypothetical protein